MMKCLKSGHTKKGASMKKILTITIFLIFLTVLSACKTTTDRDKPLVMTTLFPQYDIARAIGGDLVDVRLLLTPGTDAHTFEPTPLTVAQILEADLFLFTGNQMESWVSSFITSQARESLRLVDLSRNVTLIDHTDHLHDDNHDDDHDHEIGAFELLDNGNLQNKVADVHGDHWDGQLPNVPVDGFISLSAHIVAADGTDIVLDSNGEVNALEVVLAPYAQTGIVTLENHGDHVEIYGLVEGHTYLVFNWIHDGEIHFTTPYIRVNVGQSHDDDHDHDHEIGAFELLDNDNHQNKVAYVHGEHWHGALPIVPIDGHISLSAFIMSIDGQERVLDAEGKINGLTVSFAEDANQDVVELVNHGDHVDIHGLANGHTYVVFNWTHNGEIRYTTPPIRINIGEHDTHDYDPHIWTDPINLITMTRDIRDALILTLPSEAETFTKNAAAYIEQIEVLHLAFLDLIEKSTLSTIMFGGHNVFGYFIHRYGLNYVNPYRGFSSDAEPTPQAIVNMIEVMETYQTSYLFTESLISDHVAQAIAQATNAQILYLHAMENISSEQMLAGVTLIDLMYENLEQLKIGLNYEEN
jgi:ABC-type Zn uptake system ZnuABC Zn-binding protein ZnuA